jgi:allantoin racemase
MDIRVIVPVLHSDELAEKARLEYQACASPGVELKVECVAKANGTYSIESEYDMALAQPEVMRLVREAEAGGADGCMITCFGDPGAAGAKELVSIPVVGEGEAALHFASLLGSRFTIMITQRELFPMMRKLAAQVGMAERLASVRAVGAGVLDFGLDCVPKAVDQAAEAVERASTWPP